MQKYFERFSCWNTALSSLKKSKYIQIENSYLHFLSVYICNNNKKIYILD